MVFWWCFCVVFWDYTISLSYILHTHQQWPASLHKFSLFPVHELFNWLLPIVLSLPIHQLHYVGFMSHNQPWSFVLWPLPNWSTFGFVVIFLVSPSVYWLFLCSWNFLSIWLFLFSPFYTFSHIFLVPFGCSSSSFLIYFWSYSSIKTIVTLYWKVILHPLVLLSAQDKKSLQVSSSLITSIISVSVSSSSYLVFILCTQSTGAHLSS